MDLLRDDFTLASRSPFDVISHDEPDHDPPPPIAQAERRLQARAYTLWASMLRGRQVPAFADCDPERLGDLAPNSVLLDLGDGASDPRTRNLGAVLADQCDIAAPIARLSEAPVGSLLATLADRTERCLASRAPFGFESELVNQRGAMVLYRGIVLPFSSDGDSIDVLLCAVSWKEVADPELVAALQREMKHALTATPLVARSEAPLTEWADGPAAEAEFGRIEPLAGEDGPAWRLDTARALAEQADAAERHARELRAAAIAAQLRVARLDIQGHT